MAAVDFSLSPLGSGALTSSTILLVISTFLRDSVMCMCASGPKLDIEGQPDEKHGWKDGLWIAAEEAKECLDALKAPIRLPRVTPEQLVIGRFYMVVDDQGYALIRLCVPWPPTGVPYVTKRPKDQIYGPLPEFELEEQ